jgi:hypothetical protein
VFDLTGMSWSWSCRIAVTAMLCSLAACGGGGSTPSMYSVGGTLSGLASGANVVLQDSGGNNTTVLIRTARRCPYLRQ